MTTPANLTSRHIHARTSSQTGHAADRCRVDCLTCVEDFAAIAAEWDALHARSGLACFFHDSRVILAWLHHYPARAKLRIFTLRDSADRLVAALPLSIKRGDSGGPRRLLRHLTFVGGLTELCPERQDIILDPDAPYGSADLLLASAFRRCRGEWDVLHLPFLGSQSVISMEPAVAGCGRQFELRNGHLSAHVALPATWETYLASLGTSFRKNLLKSWRKLEAEGTLEVLEAGKDISVPDAMRELKRLHDLRFGGESISFRDPRTQRFHEALATRLAADGDLGLLLLRFNGQCIAADYDLLHQGTVWSYQSGWDPAFASRSVGHIMTACSIRWAISRGQHTYDFLAGEVDYKKCWNTASRLLADYEAFSRSTLRGIVFAGARSIIRGTRHASVTLCGAVIENAGLIETSACLA